MHIYTFAGSGVYDVKVKCFTLFSRRFWLSESVPFISRAISTFESLCLTALWLPPVTSTDTGPCDHPGATGQCGINFHLEFPEFMQFKIWLSRREGHIIYGPHAIFKGFILWNGLQYYGWWPELWGQPTQDRKPTSLPTDSALEHSFKISLNVSLQLYKIPVRQWTQSMQYNLLKNIYRVANLYSLNVVIVIIIINYYYYYQ